MEERNNNSNTNKGGGRKLSELMERALMVRMVSWVYISLSPNSELYLLNMYSFLDFSHTSIKWSKKRKKKTHSYSLP